MMVSLLYPNNGHLPGYPSPLNEKIQPQWLFTSSELLRTPSILDGMPVSQELLNRAKGVNFIIQVGIMLKLPRLTLATASVYLHRFFMRHSMVNLPNRPGLHQYAVGATALFLATKVEENCRKMKELVVACCRVAQKQPNLVVDEQDKEFWKWRDTLLNNEDLLLESLCFDLQLDQPYRIMYELMQYYRVQDNKLLRNAAWAFLNDSHSTTMCLRFPARTIAGIALYGGAAQAGIGLPDDSHGRPWWEHLDLNLLDIKDGWNVMAQIYEDPTRPSEGDKDAYAKMEDVSSLQTTRSVASPAFGLSPAGSFGAESQGVKRDREGNDIRSELALNGGSNEAYTVSPKRRRSDSLKGSNVVPQGESKSGMLLQNGVSNRPEDVQSRIDAIVNASAPRISDPESTVSRPASMQDQDSLGAPQRRRTSSTSNRSQPPSSRDQAGSLQVSGNVLLVGHATTPGVGGSKPLDIQEVSRRSRQDGRQGSLEDRASAQKSHRDSGRSLIPPEETQVDSRHDGEGDDGDEGSEEGEL